jgi:hypothetical protein
MDTDGAMSCGNGVAWDVVQGATNNSVLAGVLAGFLIAAAAVLFASPARYAPYTIALFASAVPCLALSSYIFSVMTAATPEDSERCAQLWSQGLIATAMLIIGSSVLVCGLGWVLVTYSEDFEVKLRRQMTKNLSEQGESLTQPTFETGFETRRVLLVALNGCLSAGTIAATTALLALANVLYLEASKYSAMHVFLVVETGMYVIVRSVYIVIRRTSDALDTIRGTEPTTPDPSTQFGKEILLFVLVIAVTTFVAAWIADCDWKAIAIAVLVYFIGRSWYLLRRGGPITEDRSAVAKSIKFKVGKLPPTIYSVVLWPVVATLFVTALALRPMLTPIRVYLTLGIAGFYPGVILLGLSYSVAAGRLDYVPKWLRGTRFWQYVP